MYQEMRQTLSSCLGAGSEAWKLSAGFRSIPGIDNMSAVDAVGLLRKLDRITRNKIAHWSAASSEPQRTAAPTMVDAIHDAMC